MVQQDWIIDSFPGPPQQKSSLLPFAAFPITKPLETTNAPQEFRSVFFSKIVPIINIITSGKQTVNYLQF